MLKNRKRKKKKEKERKRKKKKERERKRKEMKYKLGRVLPSTGSRKGRVLNIDFTIIECTNCSIYGNHNIIHGHGNRINGRGNICYGYSNKINNRRLHHNIINQEGIQLEGLDKFRKTFGEPELIDFSDKDPENYWDRLKNENENKKREDSLLTKSNDPGANSDIKALRIGGSLFGNGYVFRNGEQKDEIKPKTVNLNQKQANE